MPYLNKKYLYINGTSISAGGGFEEYQYRKDVRDAYSNANIHLPHTQLECTYGWFIANEWKYELINQAQSGGGIERMIRTSLEWISKNHNKLEETIFIFEPQFGIRLDWYVNEWQDFGILNASKNIEGKYPFTLVKNWFIDDEKKQIDWNNKYKKSIDLYMDNFFNSDNQFEKELNLLLMFISYLNFLKIDYYISYPNSTPQTIKNTFYNLIPEKSDLNKLLGTDIWEYAKQKFLLICNEVKNGDNHIGYCGNQQIAKKIISLLKEDYDKTNYLNVFVIEKEFDETISGTNKLISPKFNKYFTFKEYKLKKTQDEKECDFCIIDCLDPYDLQLSGGVDIIKKELDNVRLTIQSKPNLLYKNFLIITVHEKITQQEFDTFSKMWVDIVGISKEKLFFVDVLLNNYIGANNIPLEFKIKVFLSKLYNKNQEFPRRNNKFTYLNGRLNENRFFVLDSVLNAYNNVEKLKSENKISLCDTKNIELIFRNIRNYLKIKDFNQFKKLNYPIYLGKIKNELSNEYDAIIDEIHPIDEHLNQMINFYSNSIFSLVNETKYGTEVFYKNNFDNLETKNSIQFSEKVLIPILAENLVFAVVDGSYYIEFEKIGFDFSYLKKIFDIDYCTNNHFENYQSVDKFINFIKDKSIDELNKIRNSHIEIIIKNKNNLLNIYYSDKFTLNEKIFLSKLTGKQI